MTGDRYGALEVVGRPLGRIDGADKVTGRARFVADLTVPGMLEARILRSPLPHARIRGIDTSRARAVPGVTAVLTGADLGGLDPYYGVAYKDQPLLAIDRVRYEGEPVAAVAAADAVAAEAALERIEVDYDPLPAVTTLEAALAPDAPLVHERLRPAGHFRDLRALRPIAGTNICHHVRRTRGDGALALERAEVVVEDVFTFPAVQHVSLESFVSIARWDGDRLTVWSGTQHPFPVRKELSEIFGVPQHRIRVIVPFVGGAFGQKCYAKYEPLAAALARAAGAPVRVWVSVTDAFRTLTRHPARIHMRTGATRDGRLVARVVRAWLDTGAYADVGPRVAGKVAYLSIGPYRWEHLDVEASAVYTHRVPAGAFRGYGAPQAEWAGESQLNRLAAELGIDPVELRLRNLLAQGEAYDPTDRPIDGDLPGLLRAAARGAGWGTPPRPGRGRGVAVGVKDGGGAHSVSASLVRLHADGTATVHVGSVEIGQGPRTAMAQIAAETLGLPLEGISVQEPDTDLVPYDQGSSASRSTALAGTAVHRAAQDVRRQLVEIAQRFFEAPADVITLADGAAHAGVRSATYAELVAAHFGTPGGELIGRGEFHSGEGEGGAPGPTAFWELGAAAAEVEVDAETGVVRVCAYASATDAGRAINPQLCEAQDEGAAVQGLGHTLFEEVRVDGGQVQNAGLIDYRVPLADDLPPTFSAEVHEDGGGPGPFGAKGVGEIGIVMPAPAVAGAVAAATGARVRDLPLTPERVWRALRAGGGA
jgi:CO/xanthine dehydrogenase Mo-binding subunit